VSHLHEREEKVCLNCNAALNGRYCHDCGQENVEPKETVWHLFVHFFNDVTHFDGKFFTTMKPLLLKPGFLTEEYVKGRRASYLNPIRMYLFISAVFFLILMSIMGNSLNLDETITVNGRQKVPIDSLNNILIAEGLDSAARKATIDSVKRMSFFAEDNFNPYPLVDSSTPKTVHKYDSLQKALPKNKRDTYFERWWTKRAIAINELVEKRGRSEVLERAWSNFFHSLPKVFFISLPLFAAMLMLLYVRRRKQYYYVSHAIFTVHIYCFSFILWTVAMLFRSVPYIGSLLSLLIPFLIFFYLYKAMRKFYKQGRAITILKFVFMYFGISILVIVLAVGVAISAFTGVAAPH
jgi:hypothetical protein